MSNLYKTGLIAALFALLSACGGPDDQGHPHDGDADHAHETAADDHGHDHDGGDHGHPHDDAAAETEAFYGEEADAPTESADAAGDAAEDEDHHHDGEGHEHQH